MGNKITIQLSRTFDGIGLRITGTTAEQFAALLGSFKPTLPDWSRHYDPDAKLWIVESEYYPALRAWCSMVIRRFDARVDDCWMGVRTSEETTPPHLNLEVELALRDLHLLPAALDHPEQVRPVYRFLARQHHPDFTGDDGERMRSLNHACVILTKTLEQEVAA